MFVHVHFCLGRGVFNSLGYIGLARPYPRWGLILLVLVSSVWVHLTQVLSSEQEMSSPDA